MSNLLETLKDHPFATFMVAFLGTMAYGLVLLADALQKVAS